MSVSELEPSLRGLLCLSDYEREEKDALRRQRDEEAAALAKATAQVKQAKVR